jgi:UDP-N-acetylglucosamine 2-epimerase (non-hydrolysing)
MNIVSVVGARPNFMKVAPIHRAFQRFANVLEHHIVHTGQHYDATMSDAFFDALEMPQPSEFLGVGGGSHAAQTAAVLQKFDAVLETYQPAYVIVVGDVNSTIAAALASVKRGIRTAHVEAGLRSFDRAMPEEINRLATDAIVNDAFVTEESACDHLVREGRAKDSIYFVGNTMIDSLMFALEKPPALPQELQRLTQDGPYVVATFHRPTNVDVPDQLQSIINVLAEIGTTHRVVFPIHPRTQQQLVQWGMKLPTNVVGVAPLGYVQFVQLVKECSFVITDSGGIQEETTVLGVPCITARTSTERPVTVSLGTNTLVSPEEHHLLRAISDVAITQKARVAIPPLWDGNASERIVSIIAGILGVSTS